MIEVKCPICDSKNINCYDTELENETQYNLYYCEDCVAHFEVKYIVSDIKLIE